MLVRFFLFVITILLLVIFWELSKIHSRIKKALLSSAGSPYRAEIQDCLEALA